jgi:hypothetical protein
MQNFNIYKPECSCYGPKPPNLPPNILLPPSCYNENCNKSSPSYVDNAAKEPCTINSVQCTAINNFNDINAGKNIGVSTEISQQCGISSKTENNKLSDTKQKLDNIQNEEQDNTQNEEQNNTQNEEQNNTQNEEQNNTQNEQSKTDTSIIATNSNIQLYIIISVCVCFIIIILIILLL